MSYPPMPAMRIFIGGQELLGWKEASLRRSKKEMTGELSVSIFFTYMPRNVVHRAAVAGAEVMAYVGTHLAFVGTLDQRQGKGGKRGPTSSGGAPTTSGTGKARSISSGKQTRGGAYNVHIGPKDYTITLRARGKTKPLIDSSHDHQTGTMTGAKTKPVMEKLVKSFKVPLQWMAPVYDMDKIRFRDGAVVRSELFRVANEYGYAIYETRDGKLRVTNATGHTVGEPLVLGDNIMEFAAEQSEEPRNTQIKVKGQRTKKNVRGRDAVNREKTVNVGGKGGIKRYAPLTLQHYTDGTDEALERRAKHEADLQHQAGKEVRVDVFHVMSRTGQPWDIGNVHYVEVPTEGIFEPMECTELTYVVTPDKIETKLTMSPLPGATGSSGGGIAAGAKLDLGPITGAVAALQAYGLQRMASMGFQYAEGLYPESWGPNTYDVLNTAAGAFVQPVETAVRSIAAVAGQIPLTLDGALSAVRRITQGAIP